MFDTKKGLNSTKRILPTSAFSAYGFIAILIAREQPRLRSLLLFAVVGFVALLNGVARVFLQLHWPTDVLGGYCVGLLLLSIAVFWLERLEPEPKIA
ncbi:MAG: hypothetical protein DMF59_09715 [Acidobacteria bacterium]|nr:MAG: hypothetical protein DMF59_09715 [Acidobacteriota bacterium]